ncbi:hypothetical protein B0T14DRAFT_333051 [Immersiella caudata]|uniref:Uncharacterized protein n=1 Tax=Immersiella caudata TaxID=314043 RepID=A0AA39U3D5_9PEZI|nr:hypothetical protein B0T14DRAFT_333051 [Immersiella caudata]
MIHLPLLRIIHYLTAALAWIAIIVTAIIAYKQQFIIALAMWFTSMGIFHQYMWPSWDQDVAGICTVAWSIHLLTMWSCFATSLPSLIYRPLLGLLLGLGLVIRPDQSLGRFVVWTTSVLVLRYILFACYIVYYVDFNVIWQSFPFYYFSDTWRVSRARRLPLSSREAGLSSLNSLCGRCAFVERSRLIMGSRMGLFRMVEWHDFHTRGEFIAIFSSDASADTTDIPHSARADCQLCLLLWHSMTPR